MNKQQVLQQAIQFHQAGFLEQAETEYKKALRAQPNNADVLNRLAMLMHQKGNSPEALALLSRAIAFKAHPGIFLNKSIVLQAMGRKEEAAEACVQALKLNPDFPAAHGHLAFLMQALGRLEEAALHSQRVVAANPNSIEGHLNLGGILQAQGKHAEAAECYRRAIALSPNLGHAHMNLGITLRAMGDVRTAIEHIRRAYEINGKDAKTLIDLVAALQAAGETQEAALLVSDAALRKTSDPVENYNLGILLGKQRLRTEAASRLEKALQVKPDFYEARENLIQLLIASARYEEGMRHCRAALEINPRDFNACGGLATISMAQGKMGEAVTLYRQALTLKPDLPGIHSSLLLALNYAWGHGAESVYQEHVNFDKAFCRKFSGCSRDHVNEKLSGKRLKIGYVSGDFMVHSVAYFAETVLSRRNRRDFEIYAYSNATRADEVTDRLKTYCDFWREIAGLHDEGVAELVRQDGIDILVDLTGHTDKNRLLVFARRPAPVQVTWLGYPNTTGLSTMDYRLTDRFAEPEGMTEHLNTEKLYRLPEVFCCYTPCASQPERAGSDELKVRPSPALENGYVTFGCFNNYAKVTPPVVALWSKILHALPDAKLLLEAGGLDGPLMRGSVKESFAVHGIGEDRLILLERKPEQQYVLYHQIDIALDPFPCNGGTTSFDTLWMGVPLITLAGNTFVSRMGVSFLSNLALEELIAANEEEYVEIAKRLARDVLGLNRLRLGLRERMEDSPLMDADRFVRNLETAYREMWETWCSDKV